MKFKKLSLEGRYVRLEPLSIKHKEGLCEAVADGELWNLFVTKVPRIEAMEEFIANANTAFDEGDGLVFATVNKATAKVVGSTRFMRASLVNKRVEVGFTFLAASAQRSQINTEAKLLMLEYAFEALKLNRVEFLTDYLNQRSRNAILRLGAKQEGVLRSHVIMPNGRVRDSVLFSIIQNEWPGVKQHLTAKLARPA
ncbi:GNAT family protein [uncultured Zhongshania sp.]|uniref:GNAT family N-acetyltransferase n=1 Tax=uncultured Zhongshania sp. TaxID=1642288 RepID=UPI0025CDA844|nr:GNAT family protein [uncultured Zhongshania sp.]